MGPYLFSEFALKRGGGRGQGAICHNVVAGS